MNEAERKGALYAGGVKMSKADVIEIEGVVVEKLPNAMFKVETGKRPYRTGAYQWKAENELYQDSSGR